MDKFDQIVNLIDDVSNKIDETKSVINILHTYGLTKNSLKVLYTNKLYTDVWKLDLPAVESLSSISYNKEIANQLIEQLEYKVDIANEGLKELFTKAKNAFKIITNKFTSKFKSNLKKITAIGKLFNKLHSKVNEVPKVVKAKLPKKENIKEAINLVKELDIDNAASVIKAKEVVSKLKDVEDGSKIAEDLSKGTNGDYYKNIIELTKHADKLVDITNKLDDSKESINTLNSIKAVLASVGTIQQTYITANNLYWDVLAKNPNTLSKIKTLLQENFINDVTPVLSTVAGDPLLLFKNIIQLFM